MAFVATPRGDAWQTVGTSSAMSAGARGAQDLTKAHEAKFVVRKDEQLDVSVGKLVIRYLGNKRRSRTRP